jgi:hypothetical protein
LSEQTDGIEKIDKTMSPRRANLIGGVLMLFVLAGFFISYSLLWGSERLVSVFERMWSPFLPLLLFSIVVHELLHGLGFVLAGRVSRREIKFGAKWGVAYAHCKAPLSARAFRVATALPGILLGLLPGLLGLLVGNAWLTVYGAIMSVAALGDVLILWLLRSVPGQARVLDHPSAPGCQVVQMGKWANGQMGK